MKFKQEWEPLETFTIQATAAEIEAEPMFYNVDRQFLLDSREKRPLTTQLILALADAGVSLVSDFSLDTRSHMLMRGWLPAIPGWHHDDVDRPVDQPDYDTPLPDYRRMYCVVIDAIDAPTGSLTEFIEPNSTVDVTWPVPNDAPVYRYWDHELRHSDFNTQQIKSGQIVRFGCGDFHRAVPATSTGWRWFARLTFNPGPRSAPAKIRKQSQVYLPVLNNGW